MARKNGGGISPLLLSEQALRSRWTISRWDLQGASNIPPTSAPKTQEIISCALQACVCVLPIQDIESPRCGSQLKTILTDRTMRQMGDGGTRCILASPLWFLRVRVCLWRPMNPPVWMWVRLWSWLSPGRPWLLAEECMGVGSFNKGNSFRAPGRPWALLFIVFPPLSLWTQVGCCFCFVSSVMALPWGCGRKTQRKGVQS